MKLAYRESGSGEPLVFLHSGLETSSTDFIYQQKCFSQFYKVLAFDLRGHGDSQSTNLSNFFEDSVQDLFETLSEIGVTQIHLVGASLGALVAIYFSNRHPRVTKSLIISGVTPTKPENWNDLHLRQKENQRMLLENQETVNYFNTLHKSDWREFLTLAKDEDWYPFEETSKLKDNKCPVLIISGNQLPSETASHAIYKDVEHIQVEILPDAGHLVHQQQPELYTQSVTRFLNDSV